MTHRYQVKIDDSVLPELYTFDQLIEKGVLDDFDENIKVRQCGETDWITARKYPFAHSENTIHQRESSEHEGALREANHHKRSDIRSEADATYHERMNPNITSRWNWGAFSFSWFWGVLNGLYWPLIIIVCNFIPYAGVLISLTLSIYLGLKGNKLAWKIAKQNGTTLQAFAELQAKWNIAGIFFFAFIIIFTICYIAFALI